MRSLRKVFRPDASQCISGAAEIPDTVFEPELPEPEAPDPVEEDAVAARYHQMRRELEKAIRAEHTALLEQERAKLRSDYEASLEKARAKAARLQEAAAREATERITAAQREADNIREQARQTGYADGVEQKKAEIEAILTQMGEMLQQIQADQLAYQEDYAEELQALSLEIAEKIICTKLDADDSLLFGLVRRAVKPIREAGWIKIDVSDALGERAAMLEKMLANARPTQKVEVETRRDAHKGTCVIQTTEGVVVASVLTQLQNVRAYFEECRKNYENEQSQSEQREAAQGHSPE